ncbi:hypothetical protein BJY52DRAFT_1227032 [Lactarius psammicola]|nr:hypothetical protein BJY52DRAFT_1227032 [Lactarius psammicola]
MASSMSGKIIRDFQAQLFKTCGIQCVVLTAHEHKNGSIITGIDEANNLLDDGTRFLKYCPNWKDAPLFREWQKYAKMCFRGGDVHTTQKGCPKTVKPPISIHIKSNGCPNVPAITDADGYNAKAVQAVLQDYITTHIHELSVDYFSCKKATIPWAKLSQDPSSWIKPECVPDGFQWADPSKLRIGDVFDLLKHWRQRKQDHLEPPIWVSSCPLLKDVEQPSKHRRAPKSALPNSDDNSTEDEESENFNLEVSPPHSLSSPQGSGSFQGGRRYTSTPSSPICYDFLPCNVLLRGLLTIFPEVDATHPSIHGFTSLRLFPLRHAICLDSRTPHTQRRSTPEMEWTSSPDHVLEERQEGQGHDKDYDSGPDDSGTFQSNSQGSFDESDHGKRQVKITERAKYMDTGRSVGGINTHFLQRDAPWFRQWCASGCSEIEENTPTYQSAEMYPGPMKGVQKWTCTLQSVEIPLVHQCRLSHEIWKILRRWLTLAVHELWEILPVGWPINYGVLGCSKVAPWQWQGQMTAWMKERGCPRGHNGEGEREGGGRGRGRGLRGFWGGPRRCGSSGKGQTAWVKEGEGSKGVLGQSKGVPWQWRGPDSLGKGEGGVQEASERAQWCGSSGEGQTAQVRGREASERSPRGCDDEGEGEGKGKGDGGSKGVLGWSEEAQWQWRGPDSLDEGEGWV